MKRILFLSAAAVLAASLLSCNKQESIAPPHENGNGNNSGVTISIKGTPGFKSSGLDLAGESKVNNLQVFVFNGENLEAHRYEENTLATVVPASSGERTVWAVVNAPDLYSMLNSEAEPMTMSKLVDTMSDYSDNSYGDFVMTGSVATELRDGMDLTINVKRLVARVSINKVSASFKDYREGYQMRVEAMYLINVAGNVSYGITKYADKWINKLYHEDTQYDALLFDDLFDDEIIVKNNKYEKDGFPVHEADAYTYESLIHGTYILAPGVVVAQDNSYTKEHVFYPYPNRFGSNSEERNSFDEKWTPRGTLLVIEVTLLTETLDEIHGYYSLELPILERNKTYVIDEVRMTRLPSPDPFTPIQTGESNFGINVSDWELGLNLGTINI